MPKYRIKLSACHSDFTSELNRLRKFDNENQNSFSDSTSNRNLTTKQLHLLTESLFFAGFRAYENFIHEVFILYCQEKKHSSGKKARSYLSPKNYQHAEKLIQATQDFIDWTSPANIIQRAELYLEKGFPVKDVIAAKRQALIDYKRIRNHIAHGSKASLNKYRISLRQHYGVVPKPTPPPGKFLLEADKQDPNRYKLQVFFVDLQDIADAIV